jgi:hypothetical protein
MAIFLASRSQTVIHPEPARFFEVPVPFGSLGQQLEIHHYGRIDFDRIAIQKRWAVCTAGPRRFALAREWQ